MGGMGCFRASFFREPGQLCGEPRCSYANRAEIVAV